MQRGQFLDLQGAATGFSFAACVCGVKEAERSHKVTWPIPLPSERKDQLLLNWQIHKKLSNASLGAHTVVGSQGRCLLVAHQGIAVVSGEAPLQCDGSAAHISSGAPEAPSNLLLLLRMLERPRPFLEGGNGASPSSESPARPEPPCGVSHPPAGPAALLLACSFHR